MASNKHALVYILEILRNETDEKNPLTQDEIQERLVEQYSMKISKKLLSQLVNDLCKKECFNIVRQDSIVRDGVRKRYSNFYMKRLFENNELDRIISGLLSSSHIAGDERQALMDKVIALGGPHYTPIGNTMEGMTSFQSMSDVILKHIDCIETAIAKDKQISFKYYKPGVDKGLHPNLTLSGKDRTYIFHPFHLVLHRGSYYVIGCHEGYDDMVSLRVDRLGDVKLRVYYRKLLRDIKGYQYERQFDARKYMQEHIYPLGGDSSTVRFSADRSMVGEILDWFNGNVDFIIIEDDSVECRAVVNKKAFKLWALQHVESVKVLSPGSMIYYVREAIRDGLKKYTKES